LKAAYPPKSIEVQFPLVDVSYMLHNGTYRFKALTPAATAEFIRLLGLPNVIAEGGSGLFLHAPTPDHILAQCELMGLVAQEHGKAAPVKTTFDVSSVTDF
jgi:hypothetical protein